MQLLMNKFCQVTVQSVEKGHKCSDHWLFIAEDGYSTTLMRPFVSFT